MLSLQIGNSYSKLVGLTRQQHRELGAVLSYEISEQAAYFAGGMRRRARSLLGKDGEFPSGLLHYVADWSAGATDVRVEDLRIKPSDPKEDRWTMKLSMPPYQAQIDAVNACVKAGRGCVSMPTGTGKSVTMALLINALKLKTLVVVPNLGLKRQLQESFLDYFGATNHIVVENIDSPALQTSGDYDVLVIDEAHHVAAKSYRQLNRKQWAGIYHRFYFTATPFRSKDEEQILFESVAGQVVYSLDYKKAVDLKLIVPVEAYYFEVPKTKTDAYGWQAVYSDLVVNNKARNEAIVRLLLALDSNNKSTLCLVTELKHGRTLAGENFHFANGQDDDTKHFISLFNRTVLKTLIGTTGVCGEGVDTKPCEYVVIAGLGKSKPRFLQQVGRAVRRFEGKESAKVIIILDKSHRWTKSHFDAQVKILKEYYGVMPSQIEV